VSGNKWFKLRYYLQDAISKGSAGIMTFGGAWSNHILATAAICAEAGLQSIGIIRGEQPRKPSPTLLNAAALGMQLKFVSRDRYRSQETGGTEHPHLFTLVPEGGRGPLGAQGAASIHEYIPAGVTHICCAVGTGTMIAGLANGANNTQQVIGISVLKNNHSISQEIQELRTDDRDNIVLDHRFHFGGYARHQPGLLEYMNRFYERTSIPSDFVYTAKLFYGVEHLAAEGFFPAGSSVLIIHSGGLQGNASLPKGTLIF
jgi:1-aminocyclopropane-1-carboxylate deaminase